MKSAPDNSFLSSNQDTNQFLVTKTPISFWCKRGLNLRSFIQPSETLAIELTRTHNMNTFFKILVNRQFYDIFNTTRIDLDLVTESVY